MEMKELYNTNGYVLIKNFLDITPMQCELPKPPDRGKIILYQKGEPINRKFDKSVPNCSGYRMHPRLAKFVPDVQQKLQSILNLRLYKTYYLERFYYNKMGIKTHTDNGGCEISLSVCVNKDSNSKTSFLIEKDEKTISIDTQIGDAILYKGCEVKHGRSPLEGDSNSFIHQVFFHFVNADGPNLHWAYDAMFNGGIHQ